MTWRCMDCNETADRDGNCACDRARKMPGRVSDMEERIAEMAAAVEKLTERVRVLESNEFARRVKR